MRTTGLCVCEHSLQLSSSWDLLLCVWDLSSGALLKSEDVTDVVCEEGGVDVLDAVITDMDMDHERCGEGRRGEGRGGKREEGRRGRGEGEEREEGGEGMWYWKGGKYTRK